MPTIKPTTYDNGTIKVWLGVTGWCFACINSDGKTTGGVGYGTEASALNAARSK